MAFSISGAYKLDETKVIDGMKCFLGESNDAYLVIRSYDYGPFQKALEDLTQRTARERRFGRKKKFKEATNDICMLMAEHLIIDAVGVDDLPQPYNARKCAAFLVEYREFREMVEFFARDAELFKAEELEAKEKNSET